MLGVKVRGPDLLVEHDVVVEVKELLAQPRDPMDIGLDRRGREGREVMGIRKYLFVRH